MDPARCECGVYVGPYCPRCGRGVADYRSSVFARKKKIQNELSRVRRERNKQLKRLVEMQQAYRVQERKVERLARMYRDCEDKLEGAQLELDSVEGLVDLGGIDVLSA